MLLGRISAVSTGRVAVLAAGPLIPAGGATACTPGHSPLFSFLFCERFIHL